MVLVVRYESKISFIKSDKSLFIKLDALIRIVKFLLWLPTKTSCHLSITLTMRRNNNNWNNNWSPSDRKRSADVGYSTSATSSSKKRQSRHGRVPDPLSARADRQVVPRPPRPVVPQERVPLMPSQALCGLLAYMSNTSRSIQIIKT